MTPEQIIKECARIDGRLFPYGMQLYQRAKEHSASLEWWSCDNHGSSARKEPYLESYDAINPLIRKWVQSQPDQIAASTKFNYALTDVLHACNAHEDELYGWTYIITILATPAQLAEALVNAAENKL